MYLYKTVKEKLFHVDIGFYTSFGIKVFCNGKEVGFVSDVSVDEAFVSEIARQCNYMQLKPKYLQDVVVALI